ncbi:MAG: hypothetical protein U5L09_20715 [Bacteroidales bacterium]|nr:hypothetical protein [Bacteroidales bacterium]
MSLINKLIYFSKNVKKTRDNHIVTTEEKRSWESFYRNRWQHDKVVRSTHGVNRTGSCSWKIYVKNGSVTWKFSKPIILIPDPICRIMNHVAALAEPATHGIYTVLIA